MRIEVSKYENYIAILREELVPAVGCTEPACLALAGAKLRQVLGEVPQTITVKLSGNLIKNTKSVTIPHSRGLKGIAAAIWLGITGGDPDLGLAVLSSVTDGDIRNTEMLMEDAARCSVELLDSGAKLHLVLAGTGSQSHALVEIVDTHTNFVRIEKDGQVLLGQVTGADERRLKADRSLLNVDDILSFADSVHIEDVEPILRPQIEYNTAIAEQGLAGDYGSNVGRTLIEHFGDAVGNVARALAAAASDARMDGCQLPVVINSGSGNQGIAASIPVIVYAQHHHLPLREQSGCHPPEDWHGQPFRLLRSGERGLRFRRGHCLFAGWRL